MSKQQLQREEDKRIVNLVRDALGASGAVYSNNGPLGCIDMGVCKVDMVMIKEEVPVS